MNARFPPDLLLALDGPWETARAALKAGLGMQGDSVQAQSATFDTVITLKDGGQFPYQIGTWSPIDLSGAGLAYTNPLPGPRRYVRIGRLVWVNGAIKVPVTGNANSFLFGGLPFLPKGDVSASGVLENYAFTVSFTDQGAGFTLDLGTNSAGVFAATFAGALLTNANMSGKQVRFSGWYMTAS